MNNNKLDEAALLAGGRGVFAKSSYITIGTKEYVYDLKARIDNALSIYSMESASREPSTDYCFVYLKTARKVLSKSC